MSTLTFREAASYTRKIKDMPDGERPSNRLQHYGAGSLSTVELLAIVVGSGHAVFQAEHLMKESDGLVGLATMSIEELAQVEGIGEATAIRIKAALEMGRRLLVACPTERPQVRTPADVANLLMAKMSLLEQEHLVAVLLDTRNRVISIEEVYIGTVNSAQFRTSELFKAAIRKNAVSMTLVHNHPSGDPAPSPEDVMATRTAVEAGKLLGIDVLDHIVIGRQRYVSLKERGLGFN